MVNVSAWGIEDAANNHGLLVFPVLNGAENRKPVAVCALLSVFPPALRVGMMHPLENQRGAEDSTALSSLP